MYILFLSWVSMIEKIMTETKYLKIKKLTRGKKNKNLLSIDFYVIQKTRRTG